MKELNELVELAKKADREVTWSLLPFDLAKEDWCVELVDYIALMSPHTILAIAEAFRALEQGQCGNALMEREEHHVEVVGELLKRNAELEQRAEAAEATLAELEKQEAVAWIVHAHGGDQLTQDGDYVANVEGMHGARASALFTRPAPAVSLAEMAPQRKPISMNAPISAEWAARTSGYRNGFNDCVDEILRNIEEANK